MKSRKLLCVQHGVEDQRPDGWPRCPFCSNVPALSHTPPKFAVFSPSAGGVVGEYHSRAEAERNAIHPCDRIGTFVWEPAEAGESQSNNSPTAADPSNSPTKPTQKRD